MAQPKIFFPYVEKRFPQLILANRFDYTVASIKYMLPTGLPGKKAIFIMTAAYGQGEGNYDWVYPQDVRPLEHLGLELTSFDIAGKSEHEVRKALDGVNFIIVTGGDTYYLLKHMRACNFQKILQEKVAEGVMYIGSSAGAIVCTPDIDYIAPMDNPEKSGLNEFTGFNLIPFKIVPHLNHPEWSGVARKILEKGEHDGDLMLGLLDEQFVTVNNHVFRVF